MTLKTAIDITRLPQHIAIIMDGNGRWAIQHHKERLEGHYAGVQTVHTIVETAGQLGIKYLTLYVFSQENWGRPVSEVKALMELLVETLHKEIALLDKNNVRLRVIGDLLGLPNDVRKEVFEGMQHTSFNTGLNLVLALNYSARGEILQAVNDIIQAEIDGVDEEIFRAFLSTKDIPDPDLLIRTSGEIRISNFLLWQIAYSELYFTDCLWPDFSAEEFYKAIVDFQHRERRFGKISTQL